MSEQGTRTQVVAQQERSLEIHAEIIRRCQCGRDADETVRITGQCPACGAPANVESRGKIFERIYK